MSTHAIPTQTTPAPALDSPAAVSAEMLWVAREARALAGSDDDKRRAAYLARKRALLDRVSDDDDFSAGYRAGHRAGVREGRRQA